MSIKTTYKQLRGDFSSGGLDLSVPLSGKEFSLHELGARVEIGKAPDQDFRVSNVPETKDQGSTDFCVGFEVSYTVEQDKRDRRSAPFIFAAAKKRYYNGDYSGFGLGLTHGLGVAQHDGVPKDELYPFQKTRNFMANWRNIPGEAWEDAEKNKMTKGYFFVDVYKDKYENFAAAMWHWQEIIITGLMWHSTYRVDNKQRLVVDQSGSAVGHAVGAIGKQAIDDQPGLWFKNSYENIPEFWMSADDVRRQMYYGYIMPPIERDIAELVLKYAGKAVMSDVPGAKDVYIVKDGQRHRLANEATAFAWNVRLWDDVQRVDDADFNAIPDSGKTLNWDNGVNAQIVKEIFSLSPQRFEELKKSIKF